MRADVFVAETLIAGSLFVYVGRSKTAQLPARNRNFLAASSPQNPAADASTKKPKTGAKEKHWSGTLVDVGCMVKALRRGNGAVNPDAAPGPSTSHFLGSGGASPQAGQASGGVGSSPGGGANGASPGGASDEQDAERLARVARVDSAAKQCGAAPATLTFGVATSDGLVVQFDPEGNQRASQALKGAAVEPGKKIKARVAGTLVNDWTLHVASVEIKGK